MDCRFVPRIIQSCTTLLSTGGDREVEVVEHVFTCLSFLFKHLLKHLVKDIPQILRYCHVDRLPTV